MRTSPTFPALALGVLLLIGCGQAGTPEESTAPPVAPSAVETTETTQPTTPDESPSAQETTTPEPSPAPEPSAAPPSTPETVPSSEPSAAPTPGLTSAAPSPTEPAAREWAVIFAEAKTAAEANAIPGVDDDFRAMAAELVETTDAGGCRSELTITAYHPAGFITGSDFAPGCGGSNVVWGKASGEWVPVLSMQALLDCAEFENNAIPTGHPELQCLDAAGNQVSW